MNKLTSFSSEITVNTVARVMRLNVADEAAAIKADVI